MADNYLPPINLDFGGLTVPTPADAGAETLRRLKGDGTIPPGTPPEIVRMLDDTGGDPALDTPQVFSDKDPSQLKQTPDPTDPVGSPWYVPKGPPPETMAPAWAMKNLVPDINPEQLKRNAGQYDPTFLDKAAKALGLPSGIGRMSPSDAQAEQAQRQKELEDARKTVTDQILFPGSAALDGPVDQPPVNQSVLDQNVSNAAPVQQKAKVAAQAAPELQKWRDFTEQAVQKFMTGLISMGRAGAITADLPRALGAWIRGNPNLDQNAVAEKLQEYSDGIERAIPGDPGRKDELISQLGAGAGSFASFLAGGGALKALGVPLKYATAIAGASVGGTQQFDDARAHDATVAARYLSFVVGSAFGATEAIPIDRALFWLNAKGGGAVSRILTTTAVSSLTEMGQEIVQQLGQNATAKILYDNSRDIFDGVGNAGIVAAILGGFFGMGAHSVQAVNNRLGLNSPRKAQERLRASTATPGVQTAESPSVTRLNDLAGPLAGQEVEVLGPTGDGAGVYVRLSDGTETVMGRNAVDVPVQPAPPTAADSGGSISAAESAMASPRADLRNHAPIAPITATSRYSALTPKEARAAATASALQSVRGSHRNTETGWDIEVTRAGIKKSLMGDGAKVRAEIVANLPALIERAVLVDSHADTKSRAEVVAAHRLYAPLALDGRLNAVKLTVKEYADGAKKHYAIEHVEMVGPSPVYGILQPPEGAHSHTTWPAVNIEDLVPGLKGDVSEMRSPQRLRSSFPLERTRPDTGIAEPNPPASPPTPSKKDISTRFKDAINLVVKQGRFNRGHSKAEAIYKWGQSVARVKSEGQMLELFHEGGHHLHSMLEPLLDPVITKHEAEIFKIADTLYGGGGVLKMNDIQGRRREGFATFFQVYMNNPAEARVIAPKFLPDFEAMMEQNSPGIKKELDGIRQDVERWLLSKSSAQLARERVVSNKPLGTIGKIVESIKGGTVLHDIATLSNRVYQATLNDQHPLTLAVRKLRTIAEENVRVQIERGLLDKKGALAALENLARRGRADPVKMAALARNAYHASSEMIATGIAKYNGDGTAASKGLAEIIKEATGKDGRVDEATYNDFNTYLAMRRIISEWRNYYATLQWDRAKNYGPASKAAGAKEPPVKRFRRPDDVSLGDAQQAVADLEKANPQFAQAAGDVYTYLDELLQYKVDAGLLTQDGADRQRQIADYVPLRREMDDTKSGTLGKSKDARTGKDNLVRVFRGSDRRILSPVESIMQMTHETVALVAKNDVKKGLVQMALDVGRGSGAVVEQIPASTMKGTNVKLADVLKAAGDFSLADEIAQAMGRDEITMQEFMDEVLDGDEVGTIWRKADISEKGEPIIYAWRNGELEAFQLNDPEWADQLYSALTELGKEQTNLAIQILGAPAAALRAGVTSSPPFMIANLVRDQLGAWVLNDGVYPGVSMGKGIASDLFDRKARRLYNLSMASIGGSNIAALDKTRFGTEQTALAKIGIGVTAESSLTTALRVVESTETFTRQGIWQAAFKKAQADGLNIADAMIEAGFEASDYANYGRAGSKMLLARRLITFLNANLQNMDKSLRVALGGEGGAALLRKELAPWVRRQLSPAAAARLGIEGSQTSLPMTAQEKAQLARAGRTLSKMMMLAIPSALLAALYWDDEEYQDFSPYLKGTRWMVKIAPGKWLSIPKPFQLASIATFVEYSIDAVLRGDPTAMQKFMQSQAGVIAPPYENPAIKQFYELATNTDMFSGRPIVTPSVAARPNWLQYDEYTSELGKAIGRWTGASPMIVDHVITGSFATWGRGFLSASNLFNPSRPSQGLDDFAFTSYFVKDGSRSSTVRPAFLDLVGQQQGTLAGAYSGYRELMESGAEGQARELLDNFTEDQKVFALLYYHQKADAKKLHPLRNAYDIAQTISDLRKELVVNRVKQGGKDDGEIITLSPTQQKLLNDRLSDLQVRVQRNALVVTGQPGFANRKVLPTYPLVEEIKAIDPRIAADLKLRMGSRIYTTDAVAQMWPRVKAEILAKGPKANLAPFVAKAKAAGTKIWTDGETAQ